MTSLRPFLHCPRCGERIDLEITTMLIQMVAVCRPANSVVIIRHKCKCRQHFYEVKAADIRAAARAPDAASH